jgi:hypothetical protein|tara:strand:- start:1760 stop:2095 length:336 start_codon:yes stop_codon:yes gene_type:complete
MSKFSNLTVNNSAYNLLSEVEQHKEQFNIEKLSLLKSMREKQVSAAGWKRYRDVQKMFSTADEYLNEAHIEALSAVKRPTIKSINKIFHNLELFDQTWQNARQWALIGVLS